MPSALDHVLKWAKTIPKDVELSDPVAILALAIEELAAREGIKKPATRRGRKKESADAPDRD